MVVLTSACAGLLTATVLWIPTAITLGAAASLVAVPPGPAAASA
jgi:hypothetical protein